MTEVVHKQTVNFLDGFPKRWRIDISFKLTVIIILAFLLVNLMVSGVVIGLNIRVNQNVRVESGKYNEKSKEITEHNQSIVHSRGALLGRIPRSYKLSHEGFYDLLKELSEHDLGKAWLTEIYYNYVTNIIRFNGYGQTPDSVDHFLSVLKKIKPLRDTKFELFVLHNTATNYTGQMVVSGKRKKNKLEEKVSIINVNGKTVKKTVIGDGLKVRFEEVDSSFTLDDVGQPVQTVTGNNRDMQFDTVYRELVTTSLSQSNKSGVAREKQPYVFTIQNKLGR